MRPTSIIALDPQSAESLSIAGGNYSLLITGAETGGSFAIIDMLVPPGSGPGPHAHAAFHESYYVVDGELIFRSETQTYVARKGAFICIPMGGAIHNFKNESSEMAHLLCIVVKAGLEDLFREIGNPVAPGQFLPPAAIAPENAARMKEAAGRHGTELFPPDYLLR